MVKKNSLLPFYSVGVFSSRERNNSEREKNNRATIDIIKLLSTVSKDVSTPFCKGEIKGFHQLKFYSVFSYSTSMRDLLLKTLQIQKIYGNCCGATVGSEQHYNQDLRDIYKGRRILEFITFYQNALHLTTFFTRMHCI